MSEQKLIVGNIKMNMETLAMREDYLAQAEDAFANLPSNATLVVCPPTVYMERFAQAFATSSVALGAQDCFWEFHGAFTGETSPKTLDDIGVEYVIIGHSERRALGESDHAVVRKCQTALRAQLTPIICVGYTQHGEEEIAGVRRSVEALTNALSKEQLQQIIFAYEPVWAIGSGKVPTTDDIQTMILFIRQIVGKHDATIGAQIPVLYGGSVSPENVVDVGVRSGAQGVLVGGASLQPETFARIAHNICQ